MIFFRNSGNIEMLNIPKQIEYWARLGQIAEQHPDLSFRFLQDMLVTVNDGEADSGNLSPSVKSDSAVIYIWDRYMRSQI